MDAMTATARPVASSVEELLAGVTERQPLKTAESLSTATFERVVIDGERFVVKYLHCDGDWVMRATGDVVCRPAVLWTSGLFDQLPGCIDHTIVGVATGLGRNGWGSAVLMRDVSEHLVPDDDSIIALDDHLLFLENMAGLHAHFWGFHDTIGLASDGIRYLIFNDHLTAIEEALGSGARVPTLVAGGYARMAEISPRCYALCREVFHDPGPFLQAVASTPRTLIHSDWKLGNLGNHPDGRTILLDWAFPGEGAACTDLAWYLGVNCRRLPQSKEDTIAVYRRALEYHGIDTAKWFDRQLGLALIGCFLQQGWSKTLGERDAELDWWEARVLEAEALL